MTDDRTHAQRFHDALKRKRLKQREQLKAEAREQGGPNDMHDDPNRVTKMVFSACDDVCREPDAIEGAREIEARTRNEEHRAHRDRDLEVVDDIQEMEERDFNPL